MPDTAVDGADAPADTAGDGEGDGGDDGCGCSVVR
jgi:hypothetical protein